jgi:hypothetical protein
MPGNAGADVHPWGLGAFTGELRVDTALHYSFHEPQDNTLAGSSEAFRHGELQLTQLGFGGNWAYRRVHARLMTQFGMYSETTPRNDPTVARGQWRLDDAYRYIAEAYAGYRFDVLRGINLQAGLFMSYIGLWSYYNFDNWTYQPSYVSSNTPWFFEGLRLQIFVTDRFKIEPWLVNGWQAYGRPNRSPGGGVQLVWRPNERLAFVGNQYAGADTLNHARRTRLHTDDSVMVKYYQKNTAGISQAAASLTLDAGCEAGGGVQCSEQYFLGLMAYHRLWFAHNTWGLTVGGGVMQNPGRYLVLLPPINGATAPSGTPYFTGNPRDKFFAWDVQLTADYMPQPFVTFRLEGTYRAANVPYFAGRGGMTPPGGNVGAAGSQVPGWAPDLRRDETRLTFALMLKL